MKHFSILSKACFISLLIALLTSTHSLAASAWNVRLNGDNGLPELSKGGNGVVSSSFIFFDKNWGWTELESNLKVTSPGQYILKGTNKTLDFDMNANISKVSNQRMLWDIDLDAKKSRKDVVGGGISFSFDIDNFGQELGNPKILSDNSGWTWGEGKSRIEMRFNPKPATIFFERGNKNELRVYFYSGNIPAGKRSYQATLTLTGDMVITPTLSERFGGEDKSNWTRNILNWKTSPVDLSFLNEPERPAGKRGFVKAKGDQLIYEDGTVAKFWGTNISAYALFNTSKENVKLQARRLSELGFNLVRLHHHDSSWVEPNIFGTQKSNNSKSINHDSMEKIDWWIKCLKDEGIYVWLDMHVERKLKAGDAISAFDEIAKGKPEVDLKGYNYVNPSIQKAMQDFTEAYAGHRNKYTNTRYVDEPAIAAVLITNENDVTNHFGNGLLPDKNVDYHSNLYMAASESFAKASNLPKDKTWRSWEHGPSKLFLNNLEHQFNLIMIKQLRDLGVKVPIVTTSTWGGNPLSALPALTSGDIIDAHAYQGYGALEQNPLFAANLTHWLSAAQILGKPMSVTEWNAEPFPLPDRHTLPLYVASQAGLQGWDAMMQYAYSQEALREPNKWEGKPSNWHAYNDPAMLATMPAAALMYRRGDVQEAKTTYVLNPGKDLFNTDISPTNSAFIRTASELGKLAISMPAVEELPWLQKSNIPASAKVYKDKRTSLIADEATEATSDTGELKRNWDKGQMIINTDKTQAVMGWVGGEKFTLADIEVTASTRNASIAVQSIDGMPINKSKNIMISLAARSVPENEGQLPFLSEPVEGQLLIKAAKGLKLFKRDINQKKQELPISYKNGQYVIKLDKSMGTYWLFMTE
ncbi:MAG: cellulase family glycosylhydrolase [Methylotenera sp.]|nr:cellulase family glycosylhydrolase [Methylotenera sp.]